MLNDNQKHLIQQNRERQKCVVPYRTSTTPTSLLYNLTHSGVLTGTATGTPSDSTISSNFRISTSLAAS